MPIFPVNMTNRSRDRIMYLNQGSYMLTVRELKVALANYPDDLEVVVQNYNNFHRVVNYDADIDLSFESQENGLVDPGNKITVGRGPKFILLI